MKSKVKKLKGTAREIEISLSSGKVREAIDVVLADIRRDAVVPGFRKGNAPEDIIAKQYSKEALEEVKRRLVPQSYQAALEESKLNPVSYPEIWDIKVDEKGILSFRAKVDVYPEIKIGKYKGIEVSSEKIKVEEKELEETMDRIRNMFAEFVDIDGPVKTGDFTVCDIEAFVDGEAISEKRENAWVEANKDASMLGMGEELCGMAKGDKKDIDVTLPEDYPDKKYAGQKAVFKVELKEIKEKKLPELNDELAEKMEKENLEKMKEEIKDQLFEKKDENNRTVMKNQILKYFNKKYSFDLPETMVRRQLDVLVKNSCEELEKKGVDKKKIDEGKGELEESLMSKAEDKVKIYFVLTEIAAKENINVSEEEIDKWLEGLAGYYKQPVDEVKKYYTENNLLGGVAEQLREDKTLDFLLEEAVITVK